VVTVSVPHGTVPAANEASLTASVESVSILAAETTHAEPVREEPVATEAAPISVPVVVTPAPLFHQPEQGDLLSQPMRHHASATEEHSHEKASEPLPEEEQSHQAQHDNRLS
jgi:ribonuclease E